MAYGAFWIMDRSLFADKKIFTDCTIRVQQEVFRSKEDFIQEHIDKYSNPIIPPVWKTLEVVSFGTLSRIFCNLLDKGIKKEKLRGSSTCHIISSLKAGVKVRSPFAIIWLIIQEHGIEHSQFSHSYRNRLMEIG